MVSDLENQWLFILEDRIVSIISVSNPVGDLKVLLEPGV